MTWWLEHPERFAMECEALHRAGIEFEIEEETRDQGVLIVHAWPVTRGSRLHVVAHFPDHYPMFRVEVSAPEIGVDRHQHRLGKNLCLLPRGTEHWDPRTLLADLLTDGLSLFFGAVSEGAGSALEDPQAEPQSDYFQYEPSASIIVQSSWELGDARSGTFQMAVVSTDGEPLRGVVLSISDFAGGELARADDNLRLTLERQPTLRGKWARCEVPVDAYGDAARLREELRSHIDLSPTPYVGGKNRRHGEVLAAVFDEEHGWPSTTGIGWVFIQTPSVTSAGAPGTHYVRAARGGPEDMRPRRTQQGDLAPKTVAIFGLGSIGLPILLQLAQAGVGTLRYVDCKQVEPGITTRTQYHYFQTGLTKVEAATQLLALQSPHVNRSGVHMRVGSPREAGQPRHHDILTEIVDGVDLIIDATAERGVQTVTSALAREHGVPYVVASATPGAWGGVVGSFQPDSHLGCPLCWLWAREDDDTLVPPSMPNGRIQPPGCADVTFVGDGADLAVIAAQATRTAQHLLTGGVPTWNLATCQLRDPTGVPVMPLWTEHTVARHPACRRCQQVSREAS